MARQKFIKYILQNKRRTTKDNRAIFYIVLEIRQGLTFIKGQDQRKIAMHPHAKHTTRALLIFNMLHKRQN